MMETPLTYDELPNDEVRKLLAAACGVIVNKQDPVMMFLTLNRIAFKEAMQAQQQAYEEFRADMTELLTLQELENRERAGRLLTAALQRSERELAQNRERALHDLQVLLDEAAAGYAQSLEKALKPQWLKRMAYVSLFTAALALAAALLVIVFYFML